MLTKFLFWGNLSCAIWNFFLFVTTKDWFCFFIMLTNTWATSNLWEYAFESD